MSVTDTADMTDITNSGPGQCATAWDREKGQECRALKLTFATKNIRKVASCWPKHGELCITIIFVEKTKSRNHGGGRFPV